MRCPKCGEQLPARDWNCISCRINVYWASQHYDDLAARRRQEGLPERSATPPFLLRAHEDAMRERAGRGGNVEHKVREIARQVMLRQAEGSAGSVADRDSDERAPVESA